MPESLIDPLWKVVGGRGTTSEAALVASEWAEVEVVMDVVSVTHAMLVKFEVPLSNCFAIIRRLRRWRWYILDEALFILDVLILLRKVPQIS